MKKIIIPAVIVAVLAASAAFCFIRFMPETGTYVVSPSGVSFYITDKTDEPIIFNGNPLTLGSPVTSDKVLILRDKLIMESFPAQTGVHLCVKLRSSKPEDKPVNEVTYPVLAEMGWIEGSEKPVVRLDEHIESGGCGFSIPSEWKAFGPESSVSPMPENGLKIIVPDNSEGRMVLCYYPDNDFAVCGTGLVTNDITFENSPDVTGAVGYYWDTADWSFVRTSNGYVFLNEGLAGDDAYTALEIARSASF